MMKKRIIAVVVLVLIGVGAYAGFRYFRPEDNHALMASGTVEATEAQLGFQAPGRIDAVAVHEGDAVKQGQLLARLDTRETEARLTQARAQVQAAQVRLQQAERDLKRNRALLGGGAIGQEAYDKAQTAQKVANSDYAQARAQVAALEAVLANMQVRASFDGIVTIRHHEPGEVVPAGTPILTIMNPNDRWVRIYIAENRLGAVQLGEHAAITTDTYPQKRYGGEVIYIASQAEFTPKNVQTTEERVKLVYAVKVRVTDDPDFELKPGMPADVHLESTGS
jgi:HlyD family secretion protein